MTNANDDRPQPDAGNSTQPPAHALTVFLTLAERQEVLRLLRLHGPTRRAGLLGALGLAGEIRPAPPR